MNHSKLSMLYQGVPLRDLPELLRTHNAAFTTHADINTIEMIRYSNLDGVKKYIYLLDGVCYYVALFLREDGTIWDRHTDCISDIYAVRGADFVKRMYGINIREVTA